MTKMYYITTRESLENNSHWFKEWHWFQIDDQGTILLVAKFLHEGMEAGWKKSHPAIQPMPHMLSRKPIHPDHAAKLKHLGVDPTHSTFDVAETVAKYAPLHGPESF